MKKIFTLPFLLIPLITSCNSNKNPFKETTIAVFADSQLHSNTPKYTGYLKNHLKFCKANNVDVIMMPGDISNNAHEAFYKFYDDTLKEVYGEDESLYPEIVYVMGNHEWWDLSEREDDNAVKLFNKYARIESENLVKRTSLSTDPNGRNLYANYYKVINGIPFVAISGESSSGMLSYAFRDELKDWMKEISRLPSVKKGGPIFVGYHYAFPEVTYSFGQGGVNNALALYDILKDYPQVILFSGDTHYSGVNERTINQVDFTDINLGSSSYSRHVSRSVTMKSYEFFENINQSGGNKDVLIGDVAVGYDNTPHIHIVKTDDQGNTTINRYFTTSNPEEAIHLGLEWNIPVNSNEDNFEYTSRRYQNTDWAIKMYNQTGLSWADGSSMDYQVNGDKLSVSFSDVIDYNYCEHYRVIITSNNDESEKYDFVSHYYKYEPEAHNYNFTIENIPFDNIKKVEVHAYDFFDNISINHLEK